MARQLVEASTDRDSVSENTQCSDERREPQPAVDKSPVISSTCDANNQQEETRGRPATGVRRLDNQRRQRADSLPPIRRLSASQPTSSSTPKTIDKYLQHYGKRTATTPPLGKDAKIIRQIHDADPHRDNASDDYDS